MNTELSFDRTDLINQIEVYKRLKLNGYFESAQKQLESIERQLAKIQQSHPSEFNALKAEIEL